MTELTRNGGARMSPDTYSQAELVRSVARIEEMLTEMNGRLRSDYVPREVWERAWEGLAEWKAQVTADIVNLEAEAARSRREHTDEHKELREYADKRVDAEREARVGGQRWAIGIGVTTALGLIGTLLTVANMAGGA